MRTWRRSTARLLVVVLAAAIVLLTPAESEGQETCTLIYACGWLCLDWGNLWGPRQIISWVCCINGECTEDYDISGCC